MQINKIQKSNIITILAVRVIWDMKKERIEKNEDGLK
jgi:hypothetical protein